MGQLPGQKSGLAGRQGIYPTGSNQGGTVRPMGTVTPPGSGQQEMAPPMRPYAPPTTFQPTGTANPFKSLTPLQGRPVLTPTALQPTRTPTPTEIIQSPFAPVQGTGFVNPFVNPIQAPTVTQPWDVAIPTANPGNQLGKKPAMPNIPQAPAGAASRPLPPFSPTYTPSNVMPTSTTPPPGFTGGGSKDGQWNVDNLGGMTMPVIDGSNPFFPTGGVTTITPQTGLIGSWMGGLSTWNPGNGVSMPTFRSGGS